MTRREWLTRSANGFGGVALTAMLAADSARSATDRSANPLAVRPPHFPPKATSVIFLFMDGGPGQMDTFDPKPRLRAEHGQKIQLPELPTTVFNITDRVFGSPFRFPPARRIGPVGQRAVPACGPERRRPLRDPLDGR